MKRRRSNLFASSLLWAFLLYYVCRTVASTPPCLSDTQISGYMTQGTEVEVGSVLELNCTLNLERINRNKIPYHVNSSDIVFKLREMDADPSLIETLDERTARLRIYNVTEKENGRWYCFTKKPNVANGVHLICGRQVAVGYRPKRVENFTCIGYHYQNLTCSWDAPPNPVKTYYRLDEYMYYNEHDTPSNRTIRTCQERENQNMTLATNCSWSIRGYTVYRREARTLYFRLLSWNSLGERIDEFKVNHHAVIVFSQPRNVNIAAVTSHGFTLSWETPVELKYENFTSGLSYEISYRSEFSYEWTVIVHDDPYCMSPLSHLIKGLIPYAVYQVRIRCRSRVATSDKMWSDYVTLEHRTRATAPVVAPVSAPQAYLVQNQANGRDITIYWKSVPRKYYYGLDYRYVVKVMPASPFIFGRLRQQRSVDELEQVVDAEEMSATFRDLDSNSAYEFRILPRNEEGVSENFTSIVVNKAYYLPSPPYELFVLHHGNSLYEIMWQNIPKDKKIANYTVFWCQSSIDNNECKSHLDWITVTAGQNNVKHKLPTPGQSSLKYLLGVASNSDSGSSGIAWAKCMQTRNDPVGNVRLDSVRMTSTTMEISWAFECKYPKEIITSYYIEYCPYDNSTNTCIGKLLRNNFTVPKDVNKYTLQGLQPYQDYGYQLFAMTSAGVKFTGWKKQRTAPSAPDDPPRNVSLINATSRSFTLSWSPSLQIHGGITHYLIRFNNREYRYSVSDPTSSRFTATITEDVVPYKDYNISVYSCYDSSCSPSSDPILKKTDVDVPGQMESPIIKLLNYTTVNVTWKPPEESNGPIHHYVVHSIARGNGSEFTWNTSTPQTHLLQTFKCPHDESPGPTYIFSVQAVNRRGEEYLYGPVSPEEHITVCSAPAPMDWILVVGIIVGLSTMFIVVIAVLVFLGRRMKHRINEGRRFIIVKLPSGLESPKDDGPRSFEHCKKDLMSRQDSDDSGKSSQPFFRRIGSVMGFNRFFKYRHESGNSQTSASSADALLYQHTERRNSASLPSNRDGSEGSTSGHDSVSSSSLTTRTQTSCGDSGTELDLQPPPSPDIFPDVFPSHNLSRACKLPSLPKVDEHEVYGSKDSGIGKGETPEKSEGSGKGGMLPYAIFSPFAKGKNEADDPPDGAQLPYSKMALGKEGISPYLLRQRDTFVPYDTGLANSEPSLFETEELTVDGKETPEALPPYLKFPFAKSVYNVNDVAPSGVSVGAYSKLAVAGSPKGKMASEHGNGGLLRPYSKFGIKRIPFSVSNNPYVTSDMSIFTKPSTSMWNNTVSPTVHAVAIDIGPTVTQNTHCDPSPGPYSKVSAICLSKDQPMASTLPTTSVEVHKGLEDVDKPAMAEALNLGSDAKDPHSLPPSYSKLKVLPDDEELTTDSAMDDPYVTSKRHSLPTLEPKPVPLEQQPNASKDSRIVPNKSGYVAHSDVAKHEGQLVNFRPVVSSPLNPKQGYVSHDAAFNTSLPVSLPGLNAEKCPEVNEEPSTSLCEPSAAIDSGGSLEIEPVLSGSDLNLEFSGLLTTNNLDDGDLSDGENHELTNSDSLNESQVLVPLKPANVKNGYVTLGELPV